MRDNNGDWITEDTALRKMYTDYFNKYFLWTVMTLLVLGAFPRLLEETLRNMQAPITNEEIRHVIFSMGSLKSPGRMDYMLYFIRVNGTLLIICFASL